MIFKKFLNNYIMILSKFIKINKKKNYLIIYIKYSSKLLNKIILINYNFKMMNLKIQIQ